MIMQPLELVKLFENLQHLELRQHAEVAHMDSTSSFEQLAALTRLNSLTVHWHHSHSNFSLLQVLHYRYLRCYVS